MSVDSQVIIFLLCERAQTEMIIINNLVIYFCFYDYDYKIVTIHDIYSIINKNQTKTLLSLKIGRCQDTKKKYMAVKLLKIGPETYLPRVKM